jgi:hypothetical protein
MHKREIERTVGDPGPNQYARCIFSEQHNVPAFHLERLHVVLRLLRLQATEELGNISGQPGAPEPMPSFSINYLRVARIMRGTLESLRRSGLVIPDENCRAQTIVHATIIHVAASSLILQSLMMSEMTWNDMLRS